MRSLLLLCSLSCAAPARAAAPLAVPGLPSLQITAEDSDPAEVQASLAILADLAQKYPGLFSPSVIGAVHFGRVPSDVDPNGRFDAPTKTIWMDTRFAFKEIAQPGFYRQGVRPEAAFFHELLHGVCAMDEGLADRYQERIAGGRQPAFLDAFKDAQAPYQDLLKKIAIASRRVRIEDRKMTRAQYQDTAPPGNPAWRESAGKEYDEAMAMSLDEARRLCVEKKAEDAAANKHLAELLGLPAETADSPDDFSKRVAEVRANDPKGFQNAMAALAQWRAERGGGGALQRQMKDGLPVLLKKFRVPRRTETDIHAGDNAEEWMVYSGEIFFYGADPAAFLDERERAYWKQIEPFLKGAGAVPEP